MKIKTGYILPLALLLSQCNNNVKKESEKEQPPNIIVILADDMGYSDLGCYGSEINTPNLDKMASEGLQMTQFYNCARCCPSRASLLTGLYPAQAGIGHMSFGLTRQPSGEHVQEYQGYFPDNVPTIADILGKNGYETIHIGKWHVGDKPAHHPLKHGFQKVYGKNVGGHYFNYDDHKIKLWLNDSTTTLPDGKYLTDAFTEHAISFMEQTPSDQPFFLYLAYTAPHFPVQAFEKDIQRYIPMYENGWEPVRQGRYERMKKMGIIPENLKLTPPYFEEGATPVWENLSSKEKNKWVRRMAAHAAMTEHMDKGIGQIFRYLKDKNQLENTVIMFLSDNGADSWDVYNRYENRRDPDAEIGSPGSFDGIGPAWANMCNTPFWLFKSWTAEGGIATPFIAYSPKYIPKPIIDKQNTSIIMDLMPTCLELAGADFPEKHNKKATTPHEGKSLVPLFSGKAPDSSRIFCWEHQGHKAIRDGKWKLVFIRENKHQLQCEWFLFDMEKDRGETTNLIKQYPEKAQELHEKWQTWADRTGVLPWREVNAWNRQLECECDTCLNEYQNEK